MDPRYYTGSDDRDDEEPCPHCEASPCDCCQSCGANPDESCSPWCLCQRCELARYQPRSEA